ncbi:MAG: proton extrusion protein PcxA, partial [Microcystaceae cyanobacterium]
MKLNTLLQTATQWFSKTPERALDRAYRAAFKIKEIEDKHFQGQKVSATSANYGESVIAYFQTEVRNNLQTIAMGLAEFKASRLFTNLSENYQDIEGYSPELESKFALILRKLKFIDEIINKYKTDDIRDREYDSTSVSNAGNLIDKKSRKETIARQQTSKSQNADTIMDSKNQNGRVTKSNKLETVSDKTGVLPRSFLKTLKRIQQEIDPKSEETEEEVIKKFRTSRYKTAISIRFILLLIIVPLLTHQLAKNFVLVPVIESYFNQHEQVVFINQDLEEEAFIELQHFEEALHFRGLIGLSPKLSPEEVEEKVKNKANEISENYRRRGIDAVANIFADIFSLAAFAVVIFISKREIEIVKSFLDEIVYNLSDSAKAFLIILFTDMFVGFHSPHG